MFPDHILFFNPGSLPNNITIEQLLSNTYVSTPRNRQIAKIAKEMGLIEKYGSGIKRVLDIFKDFGLPQPKFELIPGGFAVTVFSETMANGIKKTDLKTDLKTKQETGGFTDRVTDKVVESKGKSKGNSKGNSKGKSKGKRKEMVLALIANNNNITIPEIADKLMLSISGAEKIIRSLKADKVLSRIGPANGGHWEVLK